MESDWKSATSLAIDTAMDAIEMVKLIVIPTPATKVHSKERLRALHLSALFLIAVLGIWFQTTRTPAPTDSNALFIIIFSTIYFIVFSWLIFAALKYTHLYDPEGETFADALTLVIGFNLVSTFCAVIVSQLDVFFHFDIEDNIWQSIVFILSIGISVTYIVFRIWRLMPRKTLDHYLKAAGVILILILCAFVYLRLFIFRQ